MINKSAAYILSFMMSFVFLMSSAQAEDTQSRKTFAVAWTIDTNDAALFNKTVVAHSTKVLELWENGIIENVYIDAEKTHDFVHKGDTAKVMFFIKATTDAEARKILNDMPLVKNKVATYTLSPVGILWLKQF